MVKEKVHHKIYGEGIVKELEEADGNIRVGFTGKRGTLTFPYPGIFREFMTADNAELQSKLLETPAKEATDNE